MSSIQITRALSRTGVRALAVVGFVATACPAWAQSVTPTFTCSGTTNAATGTYAAADVNQVLNTRAVSDTDRGNQPRWSWAEPAAYVGSQTAASAPATLPAGLAWTAFTGLETGGYVGSAYPYIPNDRVGWRGKAGAEANSIRFIRYSFNLAADVDPTTFKLELSGLSADDAIAGVYMNGERWTAWTGSTGSPAQTSSPAGDSITLEANGPAQWRAGGNEIVFALYDGPPSGSSIAVLNSAMACTVVPPPAAVPAIAAPGLIALSGLVGAAAIVVRRRRRPAKHG